MECKMTDTTADDANNIHEEIHVAGAAMKPLISDRKTDNFAVKNSSNQSTLDITDICDIQNSNERFTTTNKYPVELASDDTSLNQTSHSGSISDHKNNNGCQQIAKGQTKISYDFKKRCGTSGLSGQLYETKLISLILLRALWDDNIKEFVLGTNIEGVDAFDDIVFRYEMSDTQKTNIIFLQAKHKDDPNKDKLRVEDLFKQNGDFSLIKYFGSYLKAKQKFITDKNNVMYRNSMKDIECQFIIFTSAKEQFMKKEIVENFNENSFIKTSKNSNAFKFAYDDNDVDILVSTITQYRATLLAKSLCKFILRKNWEIMMACDLIKTYHVYLAQSVITLESTDITDEAQSRLGKFRESFWTSNDTYISLMRCVVYKELAELKEITSMKASDSEIENVLKSYAFRLPLNFGNHNFRIHGSKKKQQKRFEYICSIFHKLLQNHACRELLQSFYIIVKLEDDSIGPDKIIQANDLENYRLAGLVGNLLIYDNDTKMLKFNLNEQSLSEDNIRILQHLREKYDLSRLRFDINVHCFPKLTLNSKERDRKIVLDFLNKLTFYTNQAKEDEVEYIVKQEIEKYINTQHEKLNTHFSHVRRDAIFLKVHDVIQKWWKEPNSSTYLTKSCKFYEVAEREVLNSSVLNTIHFINYEKYKNSIIEFEYEAIDALGLDSFFRNNGKKLLIITEETDFTSGKVIQYFNTSGKEKKYVLLDLDFVHFENYLAIVKEEIIRSAVPVLVLISRGNIDANNKLISAIELFKGKIIIIGHITFVNNLKTTFTESEIIIDTRNKFNNLSNKLRNIILNERIIICQGIEVNLNKIFNYASVSILSSNFLSKLIRNEKPTLGKTLLNTFYNESINYYVNQSVCRYITINVLSPPNSKNLDSNNERLFYLTAENNDIVIVTESRKTFEETCTKNVDINVHWFMKSRSNNSLVWKQSRGSLETLMNYRVRSLHIDFSLEINSLMDIQDKVVIVSAEPGMGKSTFLSHVAVNTKRLHPSLWILKINLLDNTDQFNEWKKKKTNINLIEVMTFLYKTVIQGNVNNYCLKEKIHELITINNIDEICFNDKHFAGLDTAEIKLISHFYNTNNLAVLLDGFDEICPDYASEVIQLLCVLKTSKITHLWVTSRHYNVLHQLELALNTFSFQLNPLSKLEQKQFLQKVWLHNFGLEMSSPKLCDQLLNIKCGTYVNKFYSVISPVLSDIEGKFLSLPLHLSMLAEIYQHLFQKYLNSEVSNLSDVDMEEIRDTSLMELYEKFTDMKFIKIRFGEKKHYINFTDPDMRKIIEKERKMFVENHRNIAAYSLLDKHVLLSESDIQHIHEFIENVYSGEEKTGIIEYMMHDRPIFIHFTFAEYFAVGFLFNKLNSTSCHSSTWVYLLNRLLIRDSQGIRRFINSYLQENPNFILKLRSNAKHLKIVFDTLLSQDISQGTAIHHSIQEDLDFITLFLLQCIKPLLNNENIHLFTKYIKTDISCPFCFAIIKRKTIIVKYIIEMFTDIGCKLGDLFNTHRYILPEHVLADDSCPQMFDIVLKAWSQYDADLLVDIFTGPDETDWGETKPTIIHKLVCIKKNTFARCCQYFQKLSKKDLVNLFSIKNSFGILPAHCAAFDGYFKFFTLADQLLGREEFKKMCTTPANNGSTPIRSLQLNVKRRSPYLQDILEKVYGESDENVENT